MQLNISAAYMKQLKYTLADIYCNLAIVTAPSYLPCYLRKAEICEDCCEYK